MRVDFCPDTLCLDFRGAKHDWETVSLYVNKDGSVHLICPTAHVDLFIKDGKIEPSTSASDQDNLFLRESPSLEESGKSEESPG